MKRSAGHEDGPGQKRLVRRQAGQTLGTETTRPQAQKSQIGSQTTWSGTLEFQDSQSNDQRQAVGIISCKIRNKKKVTTDWPKQLKMTTLTWDDYMKLRRLGIQIDSCIFSVDGDCDKKSHGAFIQYTCEFHRGCVLLKYTSSAIQVMFLSSWSQLNEMSTVGFIDTFKNYDSTVNLLTDLGILSHATIFSVLTKENAWQKEELQQKDKMLVEQQTFHREEVEMLKTKMKEEEAMMEKEKDEMQRERGVMQNQILEKDRTICQKDSTISEKDESLKKKDDALKKKDVALREKDNTIMRIEQEKDDLQRENNEIETSCSELKNQVLAKQATLGKLEKELECSICKEPINMAMTTECGHAHCYKCFDELTRLRERPRCPCCCASVNRVSCSHVIDNCVSIVNKSRQEKEAIQIGDETERESQGDLIQGEQGISSQSETEEMR